MMKNLYKNMLYPFRNSTEIRDTRETRLTFDGKSAKLLIPSSNTKHTGTYKIKFTNSAGSSESSAEVVVKGLLSSSFKFCFILID